MDEKEERKLEEKTEYFPAIKLYKDRKYFLVEKKILEIWKETKAPPPYYLMNDLVVELLFTSSIFINKAWFWIKVIKKYHQKPLLSKVYTRLIQFYKSETKPKYIELIMKEMTENNIIIVDSIQMDYISSLIQAKLPFLEYIDENSFSASSLITLLPIIAKQNDEQLFFKFLEIADKNSRFRNSSDFYENLILLYSLQKSPEKVISVYLECVLYIKPSVPIIDNVAAAYFELKQWNEAIELLSAHYDFPPNNRTIIKLISYYFDNSQVEEMHEFMIKFESLYITHRKKNTIYLTILDRLVDYDPTSRLIDFYKDKLQQGFGHLTPSLYAKFNQHKIDYPTPLPYGFAYHLGTKTDATVESVVDTILHSIKKA